MNNKIKIAALGALTTGLIVSIFVRIMNYDMRRDEQLYVPPASLLENQNLYTDFFYNHVPGSAWLFRTMHMLTPSDHILFSSRLAVFGGWLFLGFSIAWVTWIITRSRAMTLFATLLLVVNDVMLGVVGMTATNNFLPMPFAFLGLALFILGVQGRDVLDFRLQNPPSKLPKPANIFAAGIMLSIAASLKVSAGGFIPLIVIAALLLPAGLAFMERLKRVALPLAAGGLLGGLPVLLTLARNPEVFFAHVLGFHTGPHVAYWAANSGVGGEAVAMSLGAKIMLAFAVWFSGANIVLLLITLILFALMAAQAKSFRQFLLSDGSIMLVASIFALVFALSFVPTPAFPQYFAPPLIVLPLLLALVYSKLDASTKPVLNTVLIVSSVVGLALNAPRLVQHLPKLAQTEKWTVNRVHNAGLNIKAEMEKAGVAGKVATLLPIYPVEAGLSVYPEFATGQFAYRVADITEEELLKNFRTTSPTKVEALFAADPPAAILVGFEATLEAPMVRFAEGNGYRRIEDFKLKDRYGDGVLYLRDVE